MPMCQNPISIASACHANMSYEILTDSAQFPKGSVSIQSVFFTIYMQVGFTGY